jgi:PEP-CTERM motif
MSWGTSIWHEGDGGQGDAGGLPGSANVTIGAGSLTDIIGSLSDVTMGADMYEIFISSPSTFSATTTGNGNNPVVNPAIYLFDSSGDGLFGNDNISGTNFQASIPAGTTSSLAAGLYYVLITSSGNLPEKGTTLIFGDLTNTTAVFAASGTVNIKKYATSGTTPSPADSGKGYDIQLTGAQFAETPEPATVALIGFGLAGLAWRSRYSRR